MTDIKGLEMFSEVSIYSQQGHVRALFVEYRQAHCDFYPINCFVEIVMNLLMHKLFVTHLFLCFRGIVGCVNKTLICRIFP